jgi:hypothetical protein
MKGVRAHKYFAMTTYFWRHAVRQSRAFFYYSFRFALFFLTDSDNIFMFFCQYGVSVLFLNN